MTKPIFYIVYKTFINDLIVLNDPSVLSSPLRSACHFIHTSFIPVFLSAFCSQCNIILKTRAYMRTHFTITLIKSVLKSIILLSATLHIKKQVTKIQCLSKVRDQLAHQWDQYRSFYILIF